MRHQFALLGAAIAAALVAYSIDRTPTRTSGPAAVRTAATTAAQSGSRIEALSRTRPSTATLSSATLSPATLSPLVAFTRSGEQADAMPQAQRARTLLRTRTTANARPADADRFVANDVIVDRDGTEHVRMDRTWQGLPVVGGDVVVHSRAGRLLGVSGTLQTGRRPDLLPGIRVEDAVVAAGADVGAPLEQAPDTRLVVYARDADQALLAYQVDLLAGVDREGTPLEMTYIVDAHDGSILDKWNNVETAAATGTGKTLYSGSVPLATNSTDTGFELRDMVHGGSYTTDLKNASRKSTDTGVIFTDGDNVWGNGTTSRRASAATDAHYGVAVTWDFYATLGRNGIDNLGTGSYNRVHVSSHYVNAFWSKTCFCMSYGDGDGVTYGPLVSLDVAGHEMTHGVTSKSAKLKYSDEAGGLNEATSDIMGSMVEFFAANPNDAPDYLIGERLHLANVPGSAYQNAFRYMYRPSEDGISADCWYSGVGLLNPHYSSGPANHFFYLLAEGTERKVFGGVAHTPSVCRAGDSHSGTGSASFAGIGRDAATRIWYRALTVYLTSSASYADARRATLNAATDLYGAGSPQREAVATAWNAINVN